MAIATSQDRKTVGVTERAEVVDGAQHGLLDDVVDVGVAVQGAADDVVDERQPARDQLVQRLPVIGLRGGDGGPPVLPVHVVPSVSPCLVPVLATPHLPRGRGVVAVPGGTFTRRGEGLGDNTSPSP
jgi:hypothetical protein